MADITKQGDTFVVASVIKNFEQKAAAALEQIADEQSILADGPTNAQVIAILDSVLERQTKEIKTLRKMLRRI